MIEKISAHLLDLLQSAAVYAGGNAYAAGWTGWKRNAAAAGYVNLFDRIYIRQGDTSRPAIYVGTDAQEAEDMLDFVTCSGAAGAGTPIVEYRKLIVPLILACTSAVGMRDARQQRNQLRGNVKTILYGHRIESGYWYDMEMPGGKAGGSAVERVWESTAGTFSEAMATIPVVCRYTWNANSSA